MGLSSLCIWLSQQLSHTVELEPRNEASFDTVLSFGESPMETKQYPFVDAVF